VIEGEGAESSAKQAAEARSKLNRILKESGKELEHLKKSLQELEVQEEAHVGRLISIRNEMQNAKKISSELRASYEQSTGISLPEDDVKAKTVALEQLGKTLDYLGQKNEKFRVTQEQVNARMQEAEKAYRAMDSSVRDFNYYMNVAIEKIIRYRVAFYLLRKTIESLKNTFVFAKDIEHQFAQIEKATLGAIIDIEELRAAAIRLGKDYGIAIKDSADIMFIWAQQGKSQNDILRLTETAVLGMKAANLDAKTAVETLTSAQRIFNLTAEESITVFDKVLNVQRQFAVTTKDLAESIKLLGTTAMEFGIGMDKFLGQITAIVQVTRRTGSQIANSLKTMFARFVQDDAVRALKEIGIGVYDVQGGVRNLGTVLDELSAKWDTLSGAQRINVARLLGGIRHYTNFLVLMDQYGVSLRAAVASQQAFGFTAKVAAIEVGTTANALERLGVTFQSILIDIRWFRKGPKKACPVYFNTAAIRDYYNNHQGSYD